VLLVLVLASACFVQAKVMAFFQSITAAIESIMEPVMETVTGLMVEDDDVRKSTRAPVYNHSVNKGSGAGFAPSARCGFERESTRDSAHSSASCGSYSYSSHGPRTSLARRARWLLPRQR